MIVDVFQHVPFEDLGAIRAWLDERGLRARYTRFFANETPPPIDDVEAAATRPFRSRTGSSACSSTWK